MQKQSDILDGYLVIDFRNGNKKALALLVRRWHDKFCYHAYSYTRNAADAQDMDVLSQSCSPVIEEPLKNEPRHGSFFGRSLRAGMRQLLDQVDQHRRLHRLAQHAAYPQPASVPNPIVGGENNGRNRSRAALAHAKDDVESLLTLA